MGVIVAVAGFGMPVGQAVDSGMFGAALGVLVVLWITFNAIWIYNLTVDSGHFAVLRRSFSRISPDQRIQAIVIAFAFGALLEALAGGGAPVAVCAVMLIALGFDPLKAAAVCLLANTAPVAFGGMGNPITVLEEVTGLPADDLAAMAGRQVPFLAVLVPFALVLLVDGRARRPRDVAGRARRRLSPSPSRSSRSRTSVPTSSPTSAPRSSRRRRSCCCCACGRPRGRGPIGRRRRNGRPAIAGARGAATRRTSAPVEKPETQATRGATSGSPTCPYVFVIVIFSLAQVR